MPLHPYMIFPPRDLKDAKDKMDVEKYKNKITYLYRFSISSPIKFKKN